jgi:hypothetical protein
MRFYRLAHLTEDPIERFRYLYLGIENAISALSPKANNEGEQPWLKRVLRAEKIDCAAVLLGIRDADADPVDQLVALIYKQTRCPAFHAKDGESFFLPADFETLRAASAACEIALRLLKRVSRNLGAGLGGVYLFQGGFELTTRSIAQHARIAFSADTRPFDPSETTFSEPTCQTTELPTQTSIDRFLLTMRSTIVSPSEMIARVGIVVDGAPLSATHYETVLDTTGFTDVEFVLGLQLVQPGVDPMAYLPP